MCFFLDIVLYECRAGFDLIKTVHILQNLQRFQRLTKLVLLITKILPLNVILAHIRHIAVKQVTKVKSQCYLY